MHCRKKNDVNHTLPRYAILAPNVRTVCTVNNAKMEMTLQKKAIFDYEH